MQYRIEHVVSNVIGVQSHDVFEYCRCLVVITQAYFVELCATHHTGRNMGHADRSTHQVMASSLGEAAHGEFGGVVSGAARISDVALTQ